MIELEITHHIQKYIIGVLRRQKTARFRDLKKPGVDSNLFAYHLKLLTQRGMIKRIDSGYTLDQKGLMYADRLSESNMHVRLQPKVVSMLVVQNSDGDLLLWKRDKQPYIDTWTLPHGKVHIDDTSIGAAAEREAFEKIGIKNAPVRHVGDCYVRVKTGSELLSVALMHIFRFENDTIQNTERLEWVRPHKLHTYELAPAVERIVARTFFNDPYFFEEFESEWEV